jgi:hypothetical protein
MVGRLLQFCVIKLAAKDYDEVLFMKKRSFGRLDATGYCILETIYCLNHSLNQIKKQLQFSL